MIKDKIAVSACLLGVNCKYDGTNNLNTKLYELLKDKRVYVICPEVFSGMSIPRIPSEAFKEKVLSELGDDVTYLFDKGAKSTLDFLKEYGVTQVILKDGSPSCGFTYVYDGTFSHKRIKGMGITTKALVDAGIEVIDINEL